MKGLAIVSRGLEKTASIEISEIIGTESECLDMAVSFKFDSFKELCLLCYKSQSIDRAIYLLHEQKFDDFFNDFENAFSKLKLDEWILSGQTFKVNCKRIGEHKFNSQDAEKWAAKKIGEKSNRNGLAVDNKYHNIIFFIFIKDDTFYFGVDFSGMELNKRNYKIFAHAASLRGTIAYCLVRESGFLGNEVLVDPFSKDGIIGIEAAYFATSFALNYYRKDSFAFQKLELGIDFKGFFDEIDRKIKKKKTKIFCCDSLPKYVDYSRKNAKIAGLDKEMNFSRMEVEWIDIKFKEKSVDRIVTSLTASREANLGKIYNEFFYQCKYILKDDGAVAVIARIPDLVKKQAALHNFTLQKEKNVWSGEQQMHILVFEKDNLLNEKK